MSPCPKFALLCILIATGVATSCGTSNNTAKDNKKVATKDPTVKGSPNATGPQVATNAIVNADTVVIADSIGRGMLALYNYGSTVNRADTETLIGMVEDSNMDMSKIWAAFEQSKFPEPRFSAYDGTGGAEAPEFSSMIRLLGIKGSVYSSALIGSSVTDTGTHIKRITNKMAGKDPTTIKKAIFALGNNDFCPTGSESATTFEQQYSARYLAEIQRFASAFPKADLYFVSPLNLLLVKDVAKDGIIKLEGLSEVSPLAATFLGDPVSCKTLQKLYCPGLFTQNSKELMASLQKSIRSAVTNLAKQLSADSSRSVYFSDVSSVSFSTDMLAADCFHPNIKGQTALARESAARAAKIQTSMLLQISSR